MIEILWSEIDKYSENKVNMLKWGLIWRATQLSFYCNYGKNQGKVSVLIIGLLLDMQDYSESR